MNNKAVYMLSILALLWGIFSWRWYVCKIKGFCEDSFGREIPNKFFANISDRPERPIFKEEESERENKATVIEKTVSSGKERTFLCPSYLRSFIALGKESDFREVVKLEKFLNQSEGENLEINGIYETEDKKAVMRFQEKYAEYILTPLSSRKATGNVYGKTLAHINATECFNQNY